MYCVRGKKTIFQVASMIYYLSRNGGFGNLSNASHYPAVNIHNMRCVEIIQVLNLLEKEQDE